LQKGKREFAEQGRWKRNMQLSRSLLKRKVKNFVLCSPQKEKGCQREGGGHELAMILHSETKLKSLDMDSAI